MSNIIILLLTLFGLACGYGGEPGGPPPTEPPRESGETVTMEVTVGPEREHCVGEAPQSCLVVDGQLFYDDIEGFDYEPGYTYRIAMERYDRWPGQEPPQDAGQYGYRLIEVLEKTREP